MIHLKYELESLKSAYSALCNAKELEYSHARNLIIVSEIRYHISVTRIQMLFEKWLVSHVITRYNNADLNTQFSTLLDFSHLL